MEKLKKFLKKIDIKILILSCILSIITLVSESFAKTNSSILFLNLPKTMCFFSLYLFLIYCIIYFIKKNFYRISIKRTNWFLEFLFDKHLILVVLLLILVYLPFLIIRYPGCIGWDTEEIVRRIFNESRSCLHFPIGYQFLVKIFFDLGIKLNNVNFSIILFVLFQISLNLFSFYMCFKYMKKWNINYYYRLFILLFFALNPLFQNYIMILYHDMIYTPCVLLYILLLTDIIKNDISKKVFIKISILSIMITLTRKNGFYVILPCNLYLLIKYTNIKKQFILCSIILIISSCFTKVLDYVLIHKYNFYKSHIVEIFSVPIQNIARTSYYHPNIDGKIKSKVGYLIFYDCAGKNYSPITTDDVKNTCRNDAYYSNEKDGLKNFLEGWLDLLFMYPNIYLDSVINNTYGLYYPFTNATYLFSSQEEIIMNNEDIKPKFYFVEAKEYEPVARYNNFFNKIPLIKYIDEPGIYSWLLIILIFILKRKQKILPIMPLILTFISCMLAPTIIYHTRYAFPIMFSVLVLYAFYSHLDNLKKGKC